MSAEAQRAALKRLIAQKEALEKEIVDLSDALTADNMGGVKAKLTDAEGFPRADIDVAGTRKLRHRLAVLNTDHKALMAQIELGLAGVLPSVPGGVGGGAARSAPLPVAAQAAPPPPAGAGPSPMQIEAAGLDDAALVPFAELDSVSDGGPAASAGALVGDRLLRFGTLTSANHDELRALGRLTQRAGASSDSILLLVARGAGADRVELVLRPRRWTGQGLLGCHLKPL
jgi:26S proteasome non-ATPase regulatory subunit 9